MTPIFIKAKQLIDAGKVHVQTRTFDVAYYTVDGSQGEEHAVRINADRTVSCSCPAFALNQAKLCKHLAAVISIHTLRSPKDEKRDPPET